MLCLPFVLDKKDCSGCSACSVVCPHKCIAMCPDEEGFCYPQYDAARCTHCGLCEKTCPCREETGAASESQPVAYASYCKDQEIRRVSSSGGIFSLLAQEVIAEGGVVFGAAFASGFKVRHEWAESLEGIQKFRGSKYVQSKVGDAYAQAKAFLDQGRKVLFSGTPCQIAGLHAMIGKDDDNLICQDIICHGVPSPMLWERYVSFLNEDGKRPILQLSFRSKKTGWRNFSFLARWKDGGEYAGAQGGKRADPFLRFFLKNYCLRPSCYFCQFKTVQRNSDITLADLWGAERITDKIQDDFGTSLVLVQSEKGRRLFEKIQSSSVSYPISLEGAIACNSAAVASVKKPNQRKTFFHDFHKFEFPDFIRKYNREPLVEKVKRPLRKIKYLLIK